MIRIDLTRILINIISNIKKEEINNVKEDLSKLTQEIDFRIDSELFQRIGDIGLLFSYFESYPYVNFINFLLKKNDSILLRLIREEMMFNNSYYDLKEVLNVINVDLKKHPEEPYFFNSKAMIYREFENYEFALKFIEMALIYDKKNIEFIKNKILILSDSNRFEEAEYMIMETKLSFPFYDEILNSMRDYIDFKEAIEEQSKRLAKFEQDMVKQSNYIKNIRFDFMALAGVFIAFLTIITKMATINYSDFQDYSNYEIFLQQLLINSPWLIALLFLFVFLFIIIKKN